MNKSNLMKRISIYITFCRQHLMILFIAVTVIIYGFLSFRVINGVNSQPNSNTLNQQANSTQAIRIDQKSLNKLRALQDNSVNIQSLFNEARNNPF